MSKCFISHATNDRQFVEREIIGLLQSLNVETWFAEDNIRTSEHWERSILTALKQSDWFVLVMSASSAKSEWIKDELNWAINNRLIRIVPIIIEDCEASDFHLRLDRIQQLDYRQDAMEARNKFITLIVNSEYLPIRRSKAIIGEWSGTVHQDESPKGWAPDFSIQMYFAVTQREINGHLITDRMVEGEAVKVRFKLSGSLYYEHFLQYNYFQDDPGVTQFGSVILKLHSSGRRMEGSFLGFSAFSESIVTGTVVITKNE